ncbi:MAG: sigma-70 family RNA polymerase sigma factor [Planctomycetes bacterium]|nr:sigma-70 family RNA polymerase sigma factor [Planctomycetota bacterium]
MSTRAIDPSTLTFAKTLVRIKAKQLLRVIRDAATGSQQDLEQDLLLEVVVRWPGFDPNRGSAEAFVESVVRAKLCKMLRDAKRAKRVPGPTVSADGSDAIDPADDLRVLCIRLDVETVIGTLDAVKRSVCDQLLRESVTEAARQLRTPRSTLEYAVNSVRDRFEKSDVDQYFS